MIDKKKVLKGIRTCSQMENIWYNWKNPGSGFSSHVRDIRYVLEDLLEIDFTPKEEEEKD